MRCGLNAFGIRPRVTKPAPIPQRNYSWHMEEEPVNRARAGKPSQNISEFWETLTPEQRLELNRMCTENDIPLSGDHVVIRRNMLTGEIRDDTDEEDAFGGGGRKSKRRKSKDVEDVEDN